MAKTSDSVNLILPTSSIDKTNVLFIATPFINLKKCSMLKIGSLLTTIFCFLGTLALLIASIYFAWLYFTEGHSGQMSDAGIHIVYACILFGMSGRTLYLAFLSLSDVLK